MIRKWCSDFQISCIYHVLICQKLMFGVCLRSVWYFLFFVPITQQLTELLTAHNSFWYNTDTNDYLLFLMCKTYNVCLTVSLLKRALAMLVWVWLLILFSFLFLNVYIWCAFSDVTNKMFFDKQFALSSDLLSWCWMFNLKEYSYVCRCIPAIPAPPK